MYRTQVRECVPLQASNACALASSILLAAIALPAHVRVISPVPARIHNTDVHPCACMVCCCRLTCTRTSRQSHRCTLTCPPFAPLALVSGARRARACQVAACVHLPRKHMTRARLCMRMLPDKTCTQHSQTPVLGTRTCTPLGDCPDEQQSHSHSYPACARILVPNLVFTQATPFRAH